MIDLKMSDRDSRNLMVRMRADDWDSACAATSAAQVAPEGYKLIGTRISKEGEGRGRGRRLSLTLTYRHVDSRVTPLDLGEAASVFEKLERLARPSRAA